MYVFLFLRKKREKSLSVHIKRRDIQKLCVFSFFPIGSMQFFQRFYGRCMLTLKRKFLSIYFNVSKVYIFRNFMSDVKK